MKNLLPAIQSIVSQFDTGSINDERKQSIEPLVSYCVARLKANQPLQLNFICTHNSRRSQFSQIWAQVAAYANGIALNSYSGGVEITAFNERAVASIKRFGFEVEHDEATTNPKYRVKYAEEAVPLVTFSKLYDDPTSPTAGFAAVMTCSHADENCPFIPGTDQRIPLRYEDPKAFDDTPREQEMYDTRSKQIGTELFYAFERVSVEITQAV